MKLAIVGIVAVLGLGALMLGGIGGGVWYWRRRRHRIGGVPHRHGPRGVGPRTHRRGPR